MKASATVTDIRAACIAQFLRLTPVSSCAAVCRAAVNADNDIACAASAPAISALFPREVVIATLRFSAEPAPVRWPPLFSQRGFYHPRHSLKATFSPNGSVTMRCVQRLRRAIAS
ncbi:hypothetical protein KCP75_17200 [Salmonella enterica subsp. enterica]|nr:hypothetical protein KCP75_17200 [Salmonella enterica subsp. enterica]